MDLEWLKARKAELRLTDAAIAKAINRDRSIANKIISGKVPFSLTYIDGFAEVFKVSRAEILRRAGILPEGEGHLSTRPVRGAVAASRFREPRIERGQREPIDDASIAREAYILTVEGNSMDMVADPGTMIVIDPNDTTLWPGRRYVVMDEDGGTTFKEYQEGPARLIPLSTDDSHEEIPVGSAPMTIVGRVIRYIDRDRQRRVRS